MAIILLGSTSWLKISSRQVYRDTLSLTVLEHWERVVVSLIVQKYTSLSTVVCLKEHRVSFGLILLQILGKIYIYISRSGEHCWEDLLLHPACQVIIISLPRKGQSNHESLFIHVLVLCSFAKL